MSTPSQPGRPRPVVGPDPELLAPLVQACPAVAGLHGGRFGEVATYLPGRRVRGVRVTEAGVEIHVVGRYPASTTEIAAQVRAATAPKVGALPVHVTIEDLALPGEPDPGAATEHDPAHRTTTADPAADPPTPRAGAPAFPPTPATTSDPSGSDAAASRPPALGLDRTEESTR